MSKYQHFKIFLNQKGVRWSAMDKYLTCDKYFLATLGYNGFNDDI